MAPALVAGALAFLAAQYFAAQDRELIAKLHGVWLDHAALMALAKRDTGAWVASFLDGLVRVVAHPKD